MENTEVKARSLAYLKTTGERVYVIALTTAEDAFEPGSVQKLGAAPEDPMVLVRRPISSQMGVAHKLEVFLYDELETLEAGLERRVKEDKQKEVLHEDTSRSLAALLDGQFAGKADPRAN